jgi:hypothetical protein
MGQPAEGGPEGTGSVGAVGVVAVGEGEADVVVGVMIPLVVVGGVMVKVGVVTVDEEIVTEVDSVDVTLVTDDDTVTSVVGVSE